MAPGELEWRDRTAELFKTGDYTRLNDTDVLRRSRWNAWAVGLYSFLPGWFFSPATAARRPLITRENHYRHRRKQRGTNFRVAH